MFFNFVSIRFRKETEVAFKNQAEESFVDWLKHKSIHYIYFDQEQETFSPTFTDRSKRPDFLIPIPGCKWRGIGSQRGGAKGSQSIA